MQMKSRFVHGCGGSGTQTARCGKQAALLRRLRDALVCAVMQLVLVSASVAEQPLAKLPDLTQKEELHSSRSFATTTIVRGDKKDHISTTFVDVDADHSVVFTVDKDQEPALMCIIGGEMFVRENGVLRMTPARFWHKIGDGNAELVADEPLSPTSPPESDSSLPVAALLASESVLATHVDDKTYLFAVLQESGSIKVWKRPPSERRLMGHPVRAVLVESRSGVAQVFFNIQTGDREVGRLDHEKWKKASSELALMAAAPLDGQHADPWETMRGICARAFTRRQASWSGWRARIALMHKDRLSRNEGDRGAKEFTEDRMAALALMMLIRNRLDEALRHDESVVMDSFVRGVLLEQAMWDREIVKLPFNHMLLSLIESLDDPQGLTGIDNEMRFPLMCRFAELGFPSNSCSYAVLTKCLNEEYEGHVAAAILARWNRPAKPHQVQAVFDLIDATPLQGERLDAIETALILGRFGELDESHQELWFRHKVEQGGDIGRRRSLNYATKHADSRSYLLAKWKELQEQPEVGTAIRDVLLFEVSATEEFGQYDFISEEECRKIREELAK